MEQYVKYTEQIKKLEQEQHFIRELVRNYCKENNQYKLNMNGNLAIFSKYNRESFDKEYLKEILTEEEFNKSIIKKEIETMKIMSEQSFKNCSGFINKDR